MRRENGTGTIRKLSGNRRRKWGAFAPAVYDYEKGTISRPLIGTFKTRMEAEKALIEYDPDKFKFSKITFKEVYEMWWSKHKDKVSENTVKLYKSYYALYLSKLNDEIFVELNAIKLQRFFDTEILTSSNQQVAKIVLGLMYNYALKIELVKVNAASFIEVKKKEKKKEKKAFTEEEIEILKHSKNPIAKDLVILIYTGLRISEYLNLTTYDIQDGFIHVRKSKTDAGVRVVPIHKEIKDFINERILEKISVYINFTYQFKKLMKELNMKHTIHETRHTFASRLSRAGADQLAVSKMLGHTDTKFTEKVYTHKNLNDLKKAINQL